jgi:hypothetical protein
MFKEGIYKKWIKDNYERLKCSEITGQGNKVRNGLL